MDKSMQVSPTAHVCSKKRHSGIGGLVSVSVLCTSFTSLYAMKTVCERSILAKGHIVMQRGCCPSDLRARGRPKAFTYP